VEVGGAEDGERGADGGAEEIVACQDGRDVARVAVGKVAVADSNASVALFPDMWKGQKRRGRGERAYLSTAWKRRNVPLAKRAEAMMGTIQ
jgi:hypothetical protein